MKYMRLVDIDRLINVMVYDDKEKAWKEMRMTIEAFLNRSSPDLIPIIAAEAASAVIENGEVRLETLKII